MRITHIGLACGIIAGFFLSWAPVSAEEASTTDLQAQNLDALAITGTLQASFDRDDLTGVWSVHAAGFYTGAGGNATILDTFIYGTDDQGTEIGSKHFSLASNLSVSSPFQVDLNTPSPDISWSSVGFGIYLTDINGKNGTVRSVPLPVLWNHPVILDHAYSGEILEPSNYVPGGVPAGIGIPHSAINGIPEGDYYAVVFFEGLVGCPSNNYTINAFVPGNYWGYDTVVPQGWPSKAWGTSAGGCMQPFHIDPKKDGGWLWGALDPNKATRAIADTNDIPAFAICGTKDACDVIAPRLLGSSTPPATTTDTTHRVSNLLFLPGIKGSALFETNPLCIIPTTACDLSLWIPLIDAVTPSLFMDTHGKSLHAVYTKVDGVLKSAFGFSFYESFTQLLDDAQKDGSFGSGWEWKAIAYDWRMSLSDLLTGGTEHGKNLSYSSSTTLPYIERSLRELASTSPTGKVTIVAHSNGGLVAKALLQKLGSSTASQLVDAVILVGVPQSGAPRALAALLYGEGERIPESGILKNLIMSAVHAREFALNAPMAYHLLPSAAYMVAQSPSLPLIRFAGTTLFAQERTSYGNTIDTIHELHDYLLAQDGGRTQPASKDLQKPFVGNSELLLYASTTHAEIDTWTPPPGIEVYQIGGYNLNTISGIEEYAALRRDGTQKQSYRPLFSLNGDDTVPTSSSFLMGSDAHVHSLRIDLGNLNGPSYSHATLLEMPSVQNAITSILHGSTTALMTFNTSQSRSVSQTQKRIAFFLHGNGSLEITDAQGSSAGAIENAGQEIPGSTAGTLGDVTYVLVPEGNEYTATINTAEDGSMALDIQDLDGDTVTATHSISDIPFTTSTVAIVHIHGDTQHTSSLEIDTDGDGTQDATIPIPTNSSATVFDVSTSTSAITHASRAVGAHGEASTSTTTTTLSEKKMVAPPHATSTIKRIAVARIRALAHPLAYATSSPEPTLEELHDVPVETTTYSLWQRMVRFFKDILAHLFR